MKRFGEKAQQYKYRLFVEEGIDKETNNFYQNIQKIPILGTETFVKTISEKYLHKQNISIEIPEQKYMRKIFIPTMEYIFDHVAKFYDTDITSIKKVKRGYENKPRSVAIYLSIIIGQKKLTDIANFIGGLSYSAVSQIRRRIHLQLSNDKNLKQEINELTLLFNSSHNI